MERANFAEFARQSRPVCTTVGAAKYLAKVGTGQEQLRVGRVHSDTPDGTVQHAGQHDFVPVMTGVLTAKKSASAAWRAVAVCEVERATIGGELNRA